MSQRQKNTNKKKSFDAHRSLSLWRRNFFLRPFIAKRLFWRKSSWHLILQRKITERFVLSFINFPSFHSFTNYLDSTFLFAIDQQKAFPKLFVRSLFSRSGLLKSLISGLQFYFLGHFGHQTLWKIANIGEISRKFYLFFLFSLHPVLSECLVCSEI